MSNLHPARVERRSARRVLFFMTVAATLLVAAPGNGLGETRRSHVPGAPSPNPLAPAAIAKFVTPLPNPLAPAAHASSIAVNGTGNPVYALAIRQVRQDLGLGVPTTVWGYQDAVMSTATYPGPTFELNQGQPIEVRFENDLVDATGAVLPNAMPVDTTLDWANPAAVGGIVPVPVVTHLHGGNTQSPHDGLPDAWETPPVTVPVGNWQTGPLYTEPYRYDNTQEAGSLWYHDHALGVTRTNVYMGLAGLFFLRDANENALRSGPRPILPSYPYEVPLVLQDRMFNADGSLFYPDAPGIGSTAVAPSHLPEFFGDTILVNGKTWPVLAVEPRKYRLRFLNGSDSRFYDLKLVRSTGRPGPSLLVIGNELGLLDKPASPATNWANGPKKLLSIAPGERYDVVADFSATPMGTRVLLVNSAPSPYVGGDPVVPGSTDQVMAFDVTVPLDRAVPNANLGTNTSLRTQPLGTASTRGKTIAATRRILLWEADDPYGRHETLLGTVDPVVPSPGAPPLQGTLTYRDPVTEYPKAGTWEVWEFYNATIDAHPIHMHLVDFRVLNRQAISYVATPKVNTDGSIGATISNVKMVHGPRNPGAWERGRKDTVQAFAGEVTRVLVHFDQPGTYVYHCHILSHEDHEMMRSYEVR